MVLAIAASVNQGSFCLPWINSEECATAPSCEKSPPLEQYAELRDLFCRCDEAKNLAIAAQSATDDTISKLRGEHNQGAIPITVTSCCSVQDQLAEALGIYEKQLDIRPMLDIELLAMQGAFSKEEYIQLTRDRSRDVFDQHNSVLATCSKAWNLAPCSFDTVDSELTAEETAELSKQWDSLYKRAYENRNEEEAAKLRAGHASCLRKHQLQRTAYALVDLLSPIFGLSVEKYKPAVCLNFDVTVVELHSNA